MAKVKVGFIGCGGRAGAHFQKLVTFKEDVELVGYADVILARAENFRNKAGEGKAYTCYKQMLDETKPDAVVIAVEPCAHGAIELAVVERNIHFIIEKPMDLDICAAENISNLIAKNRIITSVGFQDRYQDITDKAVELLAGRRIGLVEGAWVGGIPGVWWWRKQETSGGQIIEQNIHLFDQVRYMLGEPVSVYAAGGKGIVRPAERNMPGYNVHDYSSAVIKMESGVVVNLFTGCYVKGPSKQNGLTFYCEDCVVDYALRSKLTFRDNQGNVETFNHVVDGNIEQTYILDRVFIDAIKSGDTSKIRSPYSDALKSLKLCFAAQKSIETGEVIML